MTDQFQPLEFEHFTYTDAPVAPTIDYKAAIKAELRRSACDDSPLVDISQEVWDYMIDNGFRSRNVDHFLDDQHIRTFFLLVAEAL